MSTRANPPRTCAAARANTRGRRLVRGLAGAGAAGLVAGLLTSCGGGAEAGGRGPVTLDFYAPPTPPVAYQAAADRCSKQSGGEYRIHLIKLPAQADGQRQQMVRRLAAEDASMDILGMDITWEAEFAEAGWIEPWPADLAAKVKKGTLQSAIDTGMWEGKLYAAPYVTNVQLLWYRKDLVKEPPKTWDEMITMAEKLAEQGKPHYVEIQGAQYEGAVVWFNTLVHSAGGSILTEDSSAAALGDPALKALQIMKRLADSPASDPSLSNAIEEDTRLAMEAGRAAFELNWPYVWPAMQADQPKVNGKNLAKVFAWAPYPAVHPGEPVHVTTGGLDLAVSHFSQHKRLAFKAAACIRSYQNQKQSAIKGGLAPTLKDLYINPPPKFKKLYPFYQVIYDELQHSVNRPKTPAYQSVSIVVSHLVSPPREINPPETLAAMREQIGDALNSKGLIP
ncbi:MAG TPA: ABC transporter substrate-binding protein [Segeticoccus sp.]|nr:ABC transporter substrate-binding protein [Segeticoccus sp.]